MFCYDVYPDVRSIVCVDQEAYGQNHEIRARSCFVQREVTRSAHDRIIWVKKIASGWGKQRN